MTFDQCLQFYDVPLDPNGDPTILWVADTSDPFAPFPMSRLMLNVVHDKERIENFLDKLLSKYNSEGKKSITYQSCPGAAMESAMQLLDKHGGRVLLFTS